MTDNLSAYQFHDPGLLALIDDALTTSSLAPAHLRSEITESVSFRNMAETMSILDQLNRLGIGFAPNDFGTGFTSLSYLALLHPGIIKVDQSFVNSSGEGVRSETLLEAIISIGHKLHLIVIAEGIVTSARFAKLRHLNCTLGQGNLYLAGGNCR